MNSRINFSLIVRSSNNEIRTADMSIWAPSAGCAAGRFFKSPVTRARSAMDWQRGQFASGGLSVCRSPPPFEYIFGRLLSRANWVGKRTDVSLFSGRHGEIHILSRFERCTRRYFFRSDFFALRLEGVAARHNSPHWPWGRRLGRVIFWFDIR